MSMTGEHPTSTAVSIVCPSCGEKYESPERIAEILRNSGFCVNLTCLQDLTNEPIDSAAAYRKRTGTRRSTDRHAV